MASLAASVIAGLAVGITLVVSRSIMVSSSPSFPDLTSSDDYLKQASKLEEVTAFVTKYPNAFAGVYPTPILTDDSYQIEYIVGRHPKDTDYHGQKVALLVVLTDSKGKVSTISIECGSKDGNDFRNGLPSGNVSGLLQTSKYCP